MVVIGALAAPTIAGAPPAIATDRDTGPTAAAVAPPTASTPAAAMSPTAPAPSPAAGTATTAPVVPDAPIAVTATPVDAGAVVSWQAPPSAGSDPVTTYTVTASPAGATCTWNGGPLTCTVGELLDGSAYSFRVTATNAAGTSAPSDASSSVVPLRFRDVPVASPYFAEIDWMAGEGIATGYADGTFQPSTSVQRQAMAAFLYRAKGRPNGDHPACLEAPYPDVAKDAPFCGEIAWMKAQQITTGYLDGGFHPSEPVARQAMAAFLYRYRGAPDGPHPTCLAAPFVDVPATAPFCGEIAWLKGHHITTGYADGTFRSTEAIMRQAMAAFLSRLAVTEDPTHCGALTRDETWSAAQVHDLTCNVTVPAGRTLTLRPGAIVKQWIEERRLVIDGRLRAQGTGDAPVVLTSSIDDAFGGGPGGTPNPLNWTASFGAGAVVTIDHALIRYGVLVTGSHSAPCDGTPATVVITRTRLTSSDLDASCTDLALRESTLDAAAHGRVANAHSPVIAGTTVEASAPGTRSYAWSLILDAIVDPSGIHDNTFPRTELRGAMYVTGGGVRVTDTWTLDSAAGGPTLLVGSRLDVTAGATLRTRPGTVIKTFPNATFDVDGTLRATGTAADPTVLTSAFDGSVGGGISSVTQAHDWTVTVHAGGVADLTRALVRFGDVKGVGLVTGTTLDRCTGEPATVRLGASRFDTTDIAATCTTFELRDSTLDPRSSVRLDTVDAPVVTGVTAEPDPSNPYATWPLRLSGVTDPSGIHDNTFPGTNRRGAIAVASSGVDVTTTWVLDSSATGPTLYLDAPLVVAAGATLTTSPGTVIKTIDTAAFQHDLVVHGTLTTTGTPDHPTVLTSTDDDSIGAVLGLEAPPPGTVWNVAVGPGGSATLAGALVRNGVVTITGTSENIEPYRCTGAPAALTVTAARFEAATVEATCTAVTVTGSTLDARSHVLLDTDMAPVVTGLTAEASVPGTPTDPWPLILSNVTDPSDIHDNVFPGTDTRGAILVDGWGVTVTTTWTLGAAGPGPTLYVHTGLVVAPGATLTTTPGTVIKGSGELRVQGTLRTAGTADEPTVLTSYRDAGYGATTSADASPENGDWTLAVLPGGVTDLHDTLVRFARTTSGSFLGSSAPPSVRLRGT